MSSSTSTSAATAATQTVTSTGFLFASPSTSPSSSSDGNPYWGTNGDDSSVKTLRSVFYFLGVLVLMIAAFYAIYLTRRHRLCRNEREMAETQARAHSTWRPETDEGMHKFVIAPEARAVTKCPVRFRKKK